MYSVLAPWREPLYGLARIVFGLAFAQHGLQKIFGALGGRAQPLASLLGVAGILELGGGLLISVGLWTPLVAFVLAGEMAVAYFTQHVPRGLFPIQNGGELAVLYCFAFLYLSARGGCALSLDSLRGTPDAASRGGRANSRM